MFVDLEKLIDEIDEKLNRISKLLCWFVVNGKMTNRTFFFVQREAREHRNVAADPFTRSRCAPTLVSKVIFGKFFVFVFIRSLFRHRKRKMN